MAISIRQDESDDWTAQLFREIEDWFREQYACDERDEGTRAKDRLGLAQPLHAGEHCLSEHAEAERTTWTSRPY